MTDATPWQCDDQGRLVEDIPCGNCKYSLRGLRLEGACPECHAPVGRSVHADLLRFADPRWLKRLAWGTGLLVLAIAASLPLTVAALILRDIARVGALFVVGCAAAFQIGAVWLATAPEPLSRAAKRPAARAVARFSILAGLLLSAALLECLAAGWWPKAFEGRGPVLVLAAAVLFLAGIFAMGSWARSLALRIPDDKLASRTRIVTWCVVVAVPLDQFATAALDTIGRGEPPWMENTLIGIGVVSRITAVIFGLIALVLMAFYVQRLLDAARVAANRRGTLPVTGDGNEDGARVTAAGR